MYSESLFAINLQWMLCLYFSMCDKPCAFLQACVFSEDVFWLSHLSFNILQIFLLMLEVRIRFFQQSCCVLLCPSDLSFSIGNFLFLVTNIQLYYCEWVGFNTVLLMHPIKEFICTKTMYLDRRLYAGSSCWRCILTLWSRSLSLITVWSKINSKLSPWLIAGTTYVRS